MYVVGRQRGGGGEGGGGSMNETVANITRIQAALKCFLNVILIAAFVITGLGI